MKLSPLSMLILAAAILLAASGCSLIPETSFRDSLHNPFPQLKRVAVLPFYNQSNEPTVDGQRVAEAYYAALQAIPGFEVLPVGVTRTQWFRYSQQYGEPSRGEDFQRLAQQMDVDAIVVGSITDYAVYYPPRLALTVHWYAANAGFHPIPAGYGLPWGTDAEKQIPRRIVREAEFELARSQLATQTPLVSGDADTMDRVPSPDEQLPPPMMPQSNVRAASAEGDIVMYPPLSGDLGDPLVFADQHALALDWSVPLPADWPDPTDLIPDPPAPQRPTATISHDPVLSHTKLYRGDDSYFTKRLADYVETADDARPGGWQGYLKRSDDFVRFCCHLHLVEMLESRGGSDQSDLILRWPLSRY